MNGRGGWAEGWTLRPIAATLRSPLWASASALTALFAFAFAVWWPNLGLIGDVVSADDLTTHQKLRFLLTSLGAIQTNFTTSQAVLTIVVAALFGLNLAVALRTIRQRAPKGAAGTTLAGLLAGLLGVGCSACGVVALSALIGTGAAATVLGALPLGGQEFAIAGVVLLAAALLVTARQADRAAACRTALPPRARRSPSEPATRHTPEPKE